MEVAVVAGEGEGEGVSRTEGGGTGVSDRYMYSRHSSAVDLVS